MALIGELENYNGLVDVKGKIAYISQQPWVFTASIRQNIIFGNEYVKEKFDKVVEVCSLKKVIIFINLHPFLNSEAYNNFNSGFGIVVIWREYFGGRKGHQFERRTTCKNFNVNYLKTWEKYLLLEHQNLIIF